MMVGQLFSEFALTFSILMGATPDVPKIDEVPVQEWIEEIPYNDEYDFFQYEITEVNGDEINGIAIDNISESNMGIVLSKEYNNVNFVVGDKILVVFEKDIADDIVDIKKVD